MSTYGDYSTVIIKKVRCVGKDCNCLIKGFHLQQLLDQEDSRCPACEAIRPAKVEQK